MVGGGVYGNAEAMKKIENNLVVRPQSELFDQKPGVNWCQKGVQSFNPEQNQITLADGTEVTYEYLVVGTGSELRWDLIEGSKQALDDENAPISSIYDLKGAYKASIMREEFKGGNALFTLPTMPIKCGGAP